MLNDGVHQGVHHVVEDDDRQRVALVDYQLKVDGVGGPCVCRDHS